MTMTRKEYEKLRYETDDSSPLFTVGDDITIPDATVEGRYRGTSVYGRAPYHPVGDVMPITKMKYSPNQKQYRYYIGGWWYLEMDLIGYGGNKQIPMFIKEN